MPRNRTTTAIERAGTLDRAQRSLEAVRQESKKAYDALTEIDPELAAIVAQVIMRNDAALRRFADA